MKIAIKEIRKSPFQTRSAMDGQLLVDLKASMKEVGLAVPIKVRPVNGKYEVVHGHRRIEAAKQLKWSEIEGIVEELTDEQAMIQGLAENIQRDDLEPLDEARAYKRLQDAFGWSTRRIAREIARAESHIRETMALLSESEQIQSMIARDSARGTRTVTPTHVREVRRTGLPVEDREAVITKAASEGLTHQQTRKVADSVKAANTEKLKDTLLDEPYSDFVHDPDRIKDVVEKHGGIDPLTKKDRPKERVWPRAVADFLRQIKQMRWWVEQFDKAVEGDQVSPEGKPFVATRLKTLRNDINRVLEKLE